MSASVLAGNDPISVVCKMKSNMAYSMARRCLRPGNVPNEVIEFLNHAFSDVEAAIKVLERVEKKEVP